MDTGADVATPATDTFDYDLVVIGGGSGGLACSKRAASHGAKVAVLDFVTPSPHGTTWGLGGTCVNVGCIPKKLMHQAALLGHAIEDAKSFGWEVERPEKPKWETLVAEVNNHIRSLNWGYRVSLRDNNVDYKNARGSLVDAHTLKLVNKRGEESTLTTKNVVLAMGGRPRYPDIPGAEHGITSDDLFWMEREPGKTLVVGASYVALECAGFLASFGYDTTVMVRSILLRGFDSESAEKIGDYMARHGTKFIRPAVPSKVEKLDNGKLRVSFTHTGVEKTEDFDTVLWAIGREPLTKDIGLQSVGVKLDEKTGKIVHNESDQTTVSNIYAIGDILQGKPELTPVAIQAGNLLADRLFAGATKLMDYRNVCTAVFTPLEYGSCGYSEDEAIAEFGVDDIEVYHQSFTPLEWTVPHREENACYTKLVCLKSEKERVIGFHFLGPNAGEVAQGFGIALQLKATKEQVDNLVGIHPTVAETFTTLTVTKSSGLDAAQAGC
ncbi:thioredoxin reductase 1 [Salpingoeca rosetta]|uniref:thioredoxin-disulfide reductase (NADPH) n=1 Tax=Salpingoeca rosetta (strain ATCC 50818 / BSB-021) TaxID=946362 RepID=F2U1T4_SALR5|nr:thioredoxin reductase 1 [Salpingoeca rosetta]EGD81586.1 thioredoxin reductase 1 [Salpingoeca rosetta]|eukprot:XP_004996790.1 thioredoxin reductase 1 [Salpingoeca rosetta]